jgi:hypothetical protein
MGLIENLHLKGVRLGAYTLVGLAYVAATPFSIKDFEQRDLAQPAGRPIQDFRSVVGSAHGVQEMANFRADLDSRQGIGVELEGLNGLLEWNPGNLIAAIHTPPSQDHQAGFQHH